MASRTASDRHDFPPMRSPRGTGQEGPDEADCNSFLFKLHRGVCSSSSRARDIFMIQVGQHSSLLFPHGQEPQ